jgi:hypothetical protein
VVSLNDYAITDRTSTGYQPWRKKSDENMKAWGGVGVNKESIFWSEEPLQTRTLQKNGFEFRLPNVDYPLICHLYENDIQGEGGKRSDIGALITDEEKEYLINVVDKEVYMSSFLHPHSHSL